MTVEHVCTRESCDHGLARWVREPIFRNAETKTLSGRWVSLRRLYAVCDDCKNDEREDYIEYGEALILLRAARIKAGLTDEDGRRLLEDDPANVYGQVLAEAS